MKTIQWLSDDSITSVVGGVRSFVNPRAGLRDFRVLSARTTAATRSGPRTDATAASPAPTGSAPAPAPAATPAASPAPIVATRAEPAVGARVSLDRTKVAVSRVAVDVTKLRRL